MSLKVKVEHFCTLFDSNFLLMGMALHESLMTHAQPFHLWVLCMDEQVENQLQQLKLPHVSLLPLQDVETQELRAVKPQRSRGEYCWTLTPFISQFVFDRDPTVQRVTYLDADLFFFDHPQVLLEEFEQSGKQILITEHGYATEYDQSLESGRFCVQFLTFCRTPAAIAVMRWWQDRCLEWCFDRVEDGKFGDQKYLDCWPELFAEQVHVLQQIEKTLAPWNVQWMEAKLHGNLQLVFYHFQGTRIVSPHRVRLYWGYQIGAKGQQLYTAYTAALQRGIDRLKAIAIPIPIMPLPKDRGTILRTLKRLLTGKAKYGTLS